MASSAALISKFLKGTSDPLVAVLASGAVTPLTRAARNLLTLAPDTPHRLYLSDMALTAQTAAGFGDAPFDIRLGRPDGRYVRCQVVEKLQAELILPDLPEPLPAGTVICNLNSRSPFESGNLPELSPHPVIRTDRDGVVRYANPASRFLLQLFGGGKDVPLPEPLLGALQACIEEEHPIEREVSSDGFHYALTFMPTKQGNSVNIYGADVTFRVRSEEKIRRMATQDELTNLTNQSSFLEHILNARAEHDPKHRLLAVLYVDLDRFSRINTTYGHQVGDALLVQVAERLQACAPDDATIGRITGDQFCVLMEHLQSITDLINTAEAILSAFDRPFEIGEHSIEQNCSLGISLNTKPHDTPETLLYEADMAMRRAKVAGRGTMSVYDESMMERVTRSVTLERMMKSALKGHEFEMHYQPKISVADSKVVGFESLIRWRHPEEGFISPGEFIPLAEDTGIIVPVGTWVIEAVCSNLRDWLNAGVDIPPVAVNCSAIQIHREDFTAIIRRCLAEYEISADLFQIEITESSLIEDMETVIARLHELSDLGIKIFLDDFGTGFSSLQYLKRLPIDYLKVDQSFIRDMLEDKGNRTITSAIVAMARELGLKVIAEGVENRKQVYSLLAMGCKEIQGFYYCRPLPAAEVPAYLRKTAETKFR